MAVEKWIRQNDREVQDFGIVKVRQHTAVSPRTGKSGTYISLEFPDWVNMLAMTPIGEVVLVRQFRHGLDDIVLEIPSGIVDAGETELEAARREFEEETGYVAEGWEYLGFVHPNPAYQANRCHSFLATGCRRVGEQRLDPGEDIDVVVLPLQEVGRRIRKGEIDQALTLAAFLRYIQMGQPQGPLFQE